MKNIAYMDESAAEFNDERHRLDVYYPGDDKISEVLVFIHGGSWSRGDKDIYSKLGDLLATKGIVSVLINYRLAPQVMIEKMAMDCASAVKWVQENISNYNGDPSKIYLMGHSAGGHLAALITMNPEFFETIKIKDAIKGCILLDAFGLNIHTLLHEHQTPYNYMLHQVFTADPEQWERGSPANFIDKIDVPFLVFVGDKTYPFIMLDNGMFVEKMEKAGKSIQWEIIKGKSHYQMIAQLEQSRNPLYEKIIGFMRGRQASA